MSNLKKNLIIHGDKILCGLFLLYAIWEIICSILQLSIAPEVVSKADEAVRVVDKYKAPAPPVVVKEWVKSNQVLNQWELGENKDQRSIFYKIDKIDVDLKNRQYNKMLSDHRDAGHVMFLLPGEDGKKKCIFPGCPHSEDPPKVFVGLCEDFRVEETSVMTILLKWEQPTVIKRATVNYCLLEKRMPSKDKEWQSVKDKDGETLKIYGAQKNAINNIENGTGNDEQVALEEGGGFMGLLNNDPVENSGLTEGVVSQEPLSFSYYDFNLKAGEKYEYRVKVMALDIKSKEIVEGAWSPNLVAVTQEDKGITFERYIPGLRDKKGEFKKDRDGKITSPDKVYIMISKQYSSPWSTKKYFIYHKQRIDVPGSIGGNVSNYRIKTELGESVYYDTKSRVRKFMYIGGPKLDGSVYSDADIKSRDKKKWKDYKIKRDFNTDWYCENVEEVVEVLKVIEQYPGDDGEMKSRTIEKKKYRYFLNVNDKKTKKKETFELKRDRYDRSLISNSK